jgi:hypothetical protein
LISLCLLSVPFLSIEEISGNLKELPQSRQWLGSHLIYGSTLQRVYAGLVVWILHHDVGRCICWFQYVPDFSQLRAVKKSNGIKYSNVESHALDIAERELLPKITEDVA